MAAELISIWGRGFLSMTDEEFASAREEGFTGPQQTLLMEIGDESKVVDVNGLDPQIARIIGMTVDGLGDDSARMTDKVLTLTVVQLKEQLDKFEVRFPKSGSRSLARVVSSRIFKLSSQIIFGKTRYFYKGGRFNVMGVSCR